MEISKELFLKYLDSERYDYICGEDEVRKYFGKPECTPSPDFLVRDRKGKPILCEVTEIKKGLPERVSFVDFTPSVRDKIEKARKQFKPFKENNCPCVLVLYGSGGRVSVQDYVIAGAMMGNVAVVVSTNKSTGEYEVRSNVYTTEGKLSYKKSLQQKRNLLNTTISAVAVLANEENSLRVRVYHNPDPKSPLRGYFVFDGQLDEHFDINCEALR